jgi:hypothetical protein
MAMNKENLHNYSIIYQDDKIINSDDSTTIQNELLKQQLLKLCEKLKDWCRENQSELSEAYIIPRREIAGGFLFLTVQKDNKYNNRFSRNLTLLENEIEESDGFRLIDFKVFEMPSPVMSFETY